MMTDSFLDYLRFEKNYSEKTIVSYGIDLTKFEEYFKGKDEKVDFTTVDADLVRGWVMNLMENGYTSASVNRKLSSLRSFYRFLLKKGVIEEDPMLKIIGPKNKKRRLSIQQRIYEKEFNYSKNVRVFNYSSTC